MEPEVNDILEQLKSIQLLGVKEWFTIREASQYMGYSERYVRKLCEQHVLSYSRPNGKTIHISKETILEYFKRGVIPSLASLTR